MKYNFIITTDDVTAHLMIKAGFQKVQESNGIYTFINSDKIQFSNDIDKTKIKYSNILCI